MNKYYCAPENQFGNHPFTLKSDVYSLGVILYEMFFHTYPFSEAQIKNYS